jgi:hypothetical protein
MSYFLINTRLNNIENETTVLSTIVNNSTQQQTLVSNGNDISSIKLYDVNTNTIRSIQGASGITLTKNSDNIIIAGPTYADFNSLQTLSAVYGGGIVYWDNASSSISWSSRILALPGGGSSDYYYEIIIPASGTNITYYKSDGTIGFVSVSSTGVRLLNNECLVYYFAEGVNHTTVNNYFAVIDYRNPNWSANNMIIIAQRNSDNSGHIKWLRTINMPISSCNYNPDTSLGSWQLTNASLMPYALLANPMFTGSPTINGNAIVTVSSPTLNGPVSITSPASGNGFIVNANNGSTNIFTVSPSTISMASNISFNYKGTDMDTVLAAKAPLTSPSFSGTTSMTNLAITSTGGTTNGLLIKDNSNNNILSVSSYGGTNVYNTTNFSSNVNMNDLKVTIPSGLNGGSNAFSVQTNTTAYILVNDAIGVSITNANLFGNTTGLLKPYFSIIYTGGQTYYSRGQVDVQQFQHTYAGVFVITFNGPHLNQSIYSGVYPFGVICTTYSTAQPSATYYVTGGATGTSGNQITVWVTNSSGTLVDFPFTVCSVP